MIVKTCLFGQRGSGAVGLVDWGADITFDRPSVVAAAATTCVIISKATTSVKELPLSQ